MTAASNKQATNKIKKSKKQKPTKQANTTDKKCVVMCVTTTHYLCFSMMRAIGKPGNFDGPPLHCTKRKKKKVRKKKEKA